MKGTCDGVFLLKLQAVILPAAILPRQTSFAGSLLLFDKKCGLTSFRWLHLFVFTEEFCFIETTLLPKLDQSNEIHFAASWWALIISGRCNTWFK